MSSYNGISEKEWLAQVERHMRHLKSAIRRGDKASIAAQAWCIRGTLSSLLYAHDLPGYAMRGPDLNDELWAADYVARAKMREADARAWRAALGVDEDEPAAT